MNPLTRALAAVLLLAAAPAARAADVTDPAELFPAGTLAYAEVRDPAAVAPQLAAVFKGSVLEDSIPFIHGRRDTTKDPRDINGKDELAVLGLLASPELAAEFKNLRGLAVGLTGFNQQGDPDVAVAILTADTPSIGLAARAFLTMHPSVRKVAAVGDVPVYQFRQPSITTGPDGRPQIQPGPPPPEGPHEPTFAYLPGLFVAGTGKAAVGEVVTRFRGKATGSLAATPLFKEAAAAHRQPGVFFFANVPEFCAKFDAANRTRSGSVEPDPYGWFKVLANAKAVRYVAGCARVRDGGLAVTVGGAFDPAQGSPVLDFLAGPGVKVELLHHAPTPATAAVAVTFPEKDRAGAVIGFLDALAKANGELGRLPGEAVRELEAKYKVPLTDGLFGKTRAVTVVLPAKQELPKGARPLPVLVLHTDGPDVAAGWEEFLPKLLADLSGSDPAQPSSETIGGVKVLSLPGAGLPWKAAVHSARKGPVIAIGLDRNLVAAAAAADPAGSVAGDKGVTLPAGDAPALFGTVALGGVVRGLGQRARPEGPVVPVPSAPRTGGPALTPEKVRKEEEKAWEALTKSFDALPPATVTARRAGNELRVEVVQPAAPAGGFAPVVDAGVGWVDVLLNRSNAGGPQYPRYGRFRGGF